MLTQEKCLDLHTNNEKKQNTVPKYKVKVQAAVLKNAAYLRCDLFGYFYDRMSRGYVYKSDLCFQFDLLHCFRIFVGVFFARAMNRRQIVSRCGGVQKCVYES